MAKAALLIMDVQNGVVEGYLDGGSEVLLAKLASVAAAARAAATPVIYVRVAFRPGAPEISGRNRSLSAARISGRLPTDERVTQMVVPMPIPRCIGSCSKRCSLARPRS